MKIRNRDKFKDFFGRNVDLFMLKSKVLDLLTNEIKSIFKKYIIVILAKRPHNSYQGKDFIVKASELIYKAIVG